MTMMSDDTKHDSDELFTTESDDDTRTDDDSTLLEEESQDENQDSLPRKEAEKKFVDAWVNKIASGKATLEELEAKQAWLAPKVAEALRSREKNKVDPDEVKKLAMEAARELLKEERQKEKAESEKKEFEGLRKKLDSLATAEQKKAIKAKYSALIEKGLTPFDALSIASEVAGVDYEGTAQERAKYPQIKVGSKQSFQEEEVDYDTYDPNSVPLSELQKKNAKKFGIR